MRRETLQLHVRGMSCGHCEAKVEASIGALLGASAEADAERGIVDVSYDEAAVSKAEISTAVRDAGYDIVDAPE